MCREDTPVQGEDAERCKGWSSPVKKRVDPSQLHEYSIFRSIPINGSSSNVNGYSMLVFRKTFGAKPNKTSRNEPRITNTSDTK